MDSKEQLKSMLQDLINDRADDADATLHSYVVSKTKELSGLGQQVQEPVEPEQEEVTQE